MKKFISGLLVSTIIITGVSGIAISKTYYSNSKTVNSKLVTDDRVAEVNSEPISLNSYKTFFAVSALSYEANTGNEIWDQKVNGKSAVDIAEESSMNLIIENKIKLLKAEEKGITLTNKQKLEVEKNSEKMYKDFVASCRDKLADVLKKVGLNEGDFCKEFKKFFQDDEIFHGLQMSLLKEYKTPLVRAEHILITVKDPTTFPSGKHTDAEAKKIAAQILYKIKAGQNFETLAKKYSEDLTSSKGGDLGYFEKDAVVKEFANAAFSLKSGQISGLVKTQYGYHIIKVISNGPIDINKLSEEQRSQIINSSGFGSYCQAELEKWKRAVNIKIINRKIEFVNTEIK